MTNAPHPPQGVSHPLNHVWLPAPGSHDATLLALGQLSHPDWVIRPAVPWLRWESSPVGNPAMCHQPSFQQRLQNVMSKWNVDGWLDAYIPYHTHCFSWNLLLGAFRDLLLKQGSVGPSFTDGSCAVQHCATRLLPPGPRGQKLE